MPAIDHCEPQVVRALRKSGWVVSDQPYPIRLTAEKGYVFADLRLERILDASAMIVAEVKCFPIGRSLLDEFYHALGQYLVYRTAMELRQLQEMLYLAIPLPVFRHIEGRPVLQAALQNYGVKLIIVDLETEVIVKWVS
jgi:hypothetical protein